MGIQVTRNSASLLLSQSKYIVDMLIRVNMKDNTPCSTPMASGVHLTKDIGQPLQDVTLYKSTVTALQYLILTRPEITFTVNKLSQFLNAPSDVHW